MFYRILLVTCILSSYLNAQNDSLLQISMELNSGEDSSPEWFESLAGQKIDLNSCSADELQILPFLSASQIDLLLNKRPFKTKREVKILLGTRTYNLCAPFIELGAFKKTLSISHLSQIILPVEKSMGIERNIYLGARYAMLSSLKITLKDQYQLGFLIQKDSGEPNLLDHISGFVQVELWRKRLKLILGNYMLNCGEGLVYASPFGTQPGAFSTAALKNRSSSARYYLSANETAGFTGLLVQSKFIERLNLILFISNSFRDANFSDRNYIYSFYLTGLHRTPNEELKRDLIAELSRGFSLDFTPLRAIALGFCLADIRFKPSIADDVLRQDETDRRRNYFRFSGDRILLYSFFGKIHYSPATFSAEMATSPKNTLAFNVNMLFDLKTWQFGFRIWHFGNTFQSPYGRSFGQQSIFPRSEQGFYSALSGRVTSQFEINIYYHQAKDLWRTYYNPLVGHGRRVFLQLAYHEGSQIKFTFRFQNQIQQDYSELLAKTAKKIKNLVRLQVEKAIASEFILRTRFEKSFISYNDGLQYSNGMLIFQEIKWQILKRLSAIFRFTSFNTSDYDSRLYEFEHDLYTTAISTVLYGSGQKWYALLELKPDALFTLTMKYRRIEYYDRTIIGSGNDRIFSDKVDLFKCQIRIRY